MDTTIYERKHASKILTSSKKAMLEIKCLMLWHREGQISGHSDKFTKISGQFQDNFKISGISGQVGPLVLSIRYSLSYNANWKMASPIGLPEIAGNDSSYNMAFKRYQIH